MRLHYSLGRTALTHVAGLALILPLVLSGTAGTAQAHGGGTPQLVNAEAGPYWVSVWTQPDPIRAGQRTHVSVAVSEAPEPGASEREAGNLVLNATVRVQMRSERQAEQILEAFATRENAVNKLLYEADMDLPAEGEWQVVIEVEGPAGAGSAGFDVEALAPKVPGSFSWPLWGGLGLALLVAGWMFQSSRTRNDRRQPTADGSQGAS